MTKSVRRKLASNSGAWQISRTVADPARLQFMLRRLGTPSALAWNPLAGHLSVLDTSRIRCELTLCALFGAKARLRESEATLARAYARIAACRAAIPTLQLMATPRPERAREQEIENILHVVAKRKRWPWVDRHRQLITDQTITVGDLDLDP